ncbi:MAG: hypothetical protein JWM28_4361 [Chitinophagaceae bacterium]|nr:hypothetical protein [Chitinophagaceae bacterium]
MRRGSLKHQADLRGTVDTYGYIFAHNGTRIDVFRNETNKLSFDTDCHGQTFADGKY